MYSNRTSTRYSLYGFVKFGYRIKGISNVINCIMFYKIICFIIFFFGELLNTIYSELVNVHQWKF